MDSQKVFYEQKQSDFTSLSHSRGLAAGKGISEKGL